MNSHLENSNLSHLKGYFFNCTPNIVFKILIMAIIISGWFDQ